MPRPGFVKRQRNACPERPKGALSVHVRPPRDHARKRNHRHFARMPADRVAVRGAVFRPVENSFEALLCRASCCRLPAGNHAVAQRSLGAFKRDRPGFACRRDPDALRQPGPLARADAGLHVEMPLTPWRLNASRDPLRTHCSSSSSAHRSPASMIVPRDRLNPCERPRRSPRRGRASRSARGN